MRTRDVIRYDKRQRERILGSIQRDGFRFLDTLRKNTGSVVRKNLFVEDLQTVDDGLWSIRIVHQCLGDEGSDSVHASEQHFPRTRAAERTGIELIALQSVLHGKIAETARLAVHAAQTLVGTDPQPSEHVLHNTVNHVAAQSVIRRIMKIFLVLHPEKTVVGTDPEFSGSRFVKATDKRLIQQDRNSLHRLLLQGLAIAPVRRYPAFPSHPERIVGIAEEQSPAQRTLARTPFFHHGKRLLGNVVMKQIFQGSNPQSPVSVRKDGINIIGRKPLVLHVQVFPSARLPVEYHHSSGMSPHIKFVVRLVDVNTLDILEGNSLDSHFGRIYLKMIVLPVVKIQSPSAGTDPQVAVDILGNATHHIVAQ